MTAMNELTKRALSLANQGFQVFPLAANSKRPITPNGYKAASNDPAEIGEWFDNQQAHNMGLRLDTKQIVVIDIDHHQQGNGIDVIKQWQRQGMQLVPDYVEQTPHAGLHYFFSSQTTLADKVIVPNVELKTKQIIIAPSQIDGKGYRPIKGHGLTHLSPLPAWLMNKLAGKSNANNRRQHRLYKSWTGQLLDELVTGTEQGQRNIYLTSLLGKLLHTGCDGETAYSLLIFANEHLTPPLPDDEVNTIFKSILKRDMSKWGDWRLDDEIKKLSKAHDQQVMDRKHVIQALKDNVREWQERHQSKQQAKNNVLPSLPTLVGAKIMEHHFKTCVFFGDENERLAVYLPREGIYTQNYRYIKRLIARMYVPFNERQADEIIYHMLNDAPVKEPTVDRYLVPVANGIWNLHQHRLMLFSPDYVFTTKIATRYVDNPVPPNIDGWTVDGWLKELACGDNEIIKLLWEVINDSLNGNYTRKKAIFLYSEQGNSGKGTFQRLIENLVGHQNVGALKVNQFDERFKLSLLVGKTVCIGDDIPPDIYIKDSSNFNSVVTGDVVTIEFKGRDSFSIYLRCTVIQSCNGLPNFHNKGGTMRRIIIVPFNNHFDGDHDNWKIKDDYLNRQDVLEYVLYQALQLDFEKFDIPSASKEALNNFELDNDPLVGFKTEFFNHIDVERIPTRFLHEYYRAYCKVNGFKPLSHPKFTRRFLKLVPNYERKIVKILPADIAKLNSIKGVNEIYAYPSPLESGKAYASFVRKQNESP